MKLNKDNFLYSAKDNLKSNKKFKIYWDSKKHIAWTDIENEKQLSRYYKSKSYDSFKEKPSKAIDYIYFFVQNLMLGYKWSIIKKLIKKDNISLDVGSGIGVYAEYCLKKGVNQSVVENNLNALKICKKKGLKSFSSLDNISPDSKFKIITFWHSLEHIKNLNTTLTKISLLLDKEGYLIIALPNINSFDSKYYHNKWAALDVPRHLWHFTRKGIELLLQENNFFLIKSHPLFMDAFYISFLSEKHNESYFPFFRGMLLGIISNIKALFNKEFSSIIYVFKKRI